MQTYIYIYVCVYSYINIYIFIYTCVYISSRAEYLGCFPQPLALLISCSKDVSLPNPVATDSSFTESSIRFSVQFSSVLYLTEPVSFRFETCFVLSRLMRTVSSLLKFKQTDSSDKTDSSFTDSSFSLN